MEQEELLMMLMLLILLLMPFWVEQVLMEVLLQKGLLLSLEEVPRMMMMTRGLRRAALYCTVATVFSK